MMFDVDCKTVSGILAQIRSGVGNLEAGRGLPDQIWRGASRHGTRYRTLLF